MCVCVCVPGWGSIRKKGALRTEGRVDLRKLELQLSVSHTVCVLGTELKSSTGVVFALNC